MKRPFLLGIDLGTTGCKALVFSSEGKILGAGHCEYPVIKRSEAEIEQDAEDWWEATKKTIGQAIKKAKSDEIAALSISSQGISFVPVDEKVRPMDYAINWLDTRASREIKQIVEKFSEAEIFKLTGKRASAAYVLPKLLWLRKNKPEIFQKAHKFLMACDFLIAKLTGKFVTDRSMAGGTLLYDVSKLEWSKELLKEFDISEEKLPQVNLSGTPIETISKEAAEELGLNPKTLVVLGGQDQKCAALGAGVKDRIASVSLGTASAITVSTDKPVFDPQRRIAVFPYLLPNLWVLEGVVATSGACLNWLRETVESLSPPGRDRQWAEFKIKSYRKFDSLAEKSSIGANGVIFFPYLTGAYSPYWNPKARAGFYGLSLSTTSGDLVRAILEGIAYEIRANINVLEEIGGKIDEVRLFGGGAKSEIWCQIITNVLNKPTCTLRTTELATLGAAILAGIGNRIYKGYEEALDFLAPKLYKSKPKADWANQYEDYFDQYNEMRARLLSN